MNLTIEEPGWETFIPIVNLSKRPSLTETNEIFLAQILNLTMRELDNRGVCPQSIKDIYASDVLLALDGEDSIQDIQYDGHKYLVKSGIWRGMFDSKGLSASYIKSMGSTIYSQIASKAELSSVADRFRNISHNFADLSDRLFNLNLMHDLTFDQMMRASGEYESKQNAQGIYLFRKKED